MDGTVSRLEKTKIGWGIADHTYLLDVAHATVSGKYMGRPD